MGKRAYIGTIEEIKKNILSNEKVTQIIEMQPTGYRGEYIIYYYGEIIQKIELKEDIKSI